MPCSSPDAGKAPKTSVAGKGGEIAVAANGLPGIDSRCVVSHRDAAADVPFLRIDGIKGCRLGVRLVGSRMP